MLSQDRDLLILEPNLFRDVQPAGQTLFTGVCDVDEFSAIITESSAPLAATGVAPGCVALIDGVAYEIMEISGIDALAISRLRADPAQLTPLMPRQKAALPIVIVSFAPQLFAVYHQVLRMAGIEPSGAPLPSTPTQSQITNAAALIPLISLGALALIYHGAGAGLPADSPENQRALLYQRRFETESERTTLSLDLNHDAIPDAIRTLRGGAMTR